MLEKEEYASGMGQKISLSDVAAKDAQIKVLEEECAGGMGYIAIRTRNLLHSGQKNSRRQL
jgi:ABC-type Na+ transport system ATPase subunit NatA